ncbi:hypothetical protein BLS_003658 [Venturia inaequalis]|uniref:Uncharacterized protein n=1 Tax=Venturia inaequalis TaxID=5025 RepID=A0A8H3UMX3_VENIN|nr:hypothetical protein BLS_003658 [Venturia inaequalis]
MAREQVKPDNLEEEMDARCKRCFAPVKTRNSSTTGASSVTKIPAKNGLNKELDRVNEMETLFAQFKASVDLDEKESLAAFLKLMEGPRDVEPKEFRQMGR